jgi:hypothetical protein
VREEVRINEALRERSYCRLCYAEKVFGAGLIIALLGLTQYFLFKNTLVLEDGVRRVYTVYGSANSVGLLFDYTLPPALALTMARTSCLWPSSPGWSSSPGSLRAF